MDEADQIVQSKKRLLIGAVHIWNGKRQGTRSNIKFKASPIENAA
jgi:hypothetical protein